MKTSLIVKGARTHNLKNASLEIPRNKLTVITGLSGSGKSSLAFDTIYAEGQRRYVESLSSYARQFLGQMEKPDVDEIDGLSPAISIDQKTTSRSPRSTVGTVTEIYDYLRLLYTHAGEAHCPKCGRKIRRETQDEIAETIEKDYPEEAVYLLSPVVEHKKGSFEKLLEDSLKAGYSRARVDGEILDLEGLVLAKGKWHNIELVMDRLRVTPDNGARLRDSLEACLNKESHTAVVINRDGSREERFSSEYKCDYCSLTLPEPEARLFSFNHPIGACPRCQGIGVEYSIDPRKLVPHPEKSISEGAIVASGWEYCDKHTITKTYFDAIALKYNISLDTPWEDITEKERGYFLYGTGEENLVLNFPGRDEEIIRPFEGVIPNLMRRYQESTFASVRSYIEERLSPKVCPMCGGTRLKKEALSFFLGGKNIAQFCDLPCDEALIFLQQLQFEEKTKEAGERLVKEILPRLDFLREVGLGYLSLSRESTTLSGGESQRIRLTTQLGSALSGVLYVLDEPSIGLHARDNIKLITALQKLRDRGNTVIVVEHDEETMRHADYLVDVGPGAGSHGGMVVAAGTPDEVMKCENSLTGKYLAGIKQIPISSKRRQGNGFSLIVHGAAENNLQHLDVAFPLGTFICVTGVSGSGKSSLVNEILAKALSRDCNHSEVVPGQFDSIEGLEHVDKSILINQNPIGRTPRSNPATYTGVFTDIRDLFASLPESRARGYEKGRFSFNVKGGRCEACGGDGLKCIKMNFLADVYVPCEVCEGRRYNRETLEVRFKAKNISEVLSMSCEEALTFFENQPGIRTKLKALVDVGLGYISLGQPSTTLSGGEAQRVKLASELLRPATGKTVYILDEPTTGLHTEDVGRLLSILHRLAEAGNTVIVIEHNPDCILSADYIIDLGPEGGKNGGRLMASGTPEQVALQPESVTGKYIRELFKARQ